MPIMSGKRKQRLMSEITHRRWQQLQLPGIAARDWIEISNAGHLQNSQQRSDEAPATDA